MNAINQEFPEAEIKGYFFHFSQCIWRQIQNSGLQTRYKDDETFALQVRKLPSLAYVLQNEVINAYNTLLDTPYFTEHDELLAPILNYFEETWIGCMDRRKNRGSPKFNISIWNCFSLILKDLPRTNNAVEGWYNCFT